MIDRLYLEAVSKPLFIFGKSETGCDVCPGRSTEALVDHTECDEDAEMKVALIVIGKHNSIFEFVPDW